MKKTFLILVCLAAFSSFSEEKQDIEFKDNQVDASSDVSPDVSSDVSSDVSPDSSPDSSPDASPDASPSDEQKQIKESKNQISESFSSDKKEGVEGDSLLTSVFENYSWFFEKKQTKNKLAILPVFYNSMSFGTVLGLRFFTYSSDYKDYYLGTSLSNQIFTSLVKWDFTYISKQQENFESHINISYNGFLELFYGEGMETKESDLEKIHSHKIDWNYELKYTHKDNTFYSAIGQVFLRKERPDLQNGKIYFPAEVLIQVRGKVGYDSRDSWIGAEQGHYHQLSFGCTPSLGEGSSFCTGEVDLRYYHNFFDKYFIALRSFVASSFISYSSYSMNYILGGRHVLRAFSENRFRGDKIYFAQSELRFPLPIWSKYLSGVVFAELGEVAKYKEEFKRFKWDFGTGLRIGIPPGYKMKLRIDVAFALSDSEKPVNFILDFFQAF